jgi:hypothetical protein
VRETTRIADNVELGSDTSSDKLGQRLMRAACSSRGSMSLVGTMSWSQIGWPVNITGEESIMGFRNVAAIVVMVLGAASIAEGQVVTFSRISDAVPSRFFDAATSAPAPLDANTLIIGLNTGFDSATWKWRVFRASTATYSYTNAMDSISFTIQAPPGFYISKITYTQRGTGSVLRTGKASGAATWIVAGRAASLGAFTTNPTLSRTMDLTGKKMTVVPVSITNSLFAYSTPSLGSATVGLTGAQVRVQLLPL